MSAIEITNKNFIKEILRYKGRSLVVFVSPWFGTPDEMLAVLQEFEDEGEYKMGWVNIDENIQLASKLRVLATPTVVGFEKGVMMGLIAEKCTREMIIEMFD